MRENLVAMKTQGVTTALAAGVLIVSTTAGCSSDSRDNASEKAAAAAQTAKAKAQSAKTKAQSTMSARASAKADGTKLIEKVQWVTTSGGGSLHVTPTKAGRSNKSATGNVAWIQVQRLAEAAGGKEAAVVDKPGMKAQFVCHWQFARVKEPNKPSWNLEPWRPVVSEKALVQARCNPGGAEGADQ